MILGRLLLKMKKGIDKGTIMILKKPSASALGTSQKSATESPSIIHSYSMVEKALIKKRHKTE
ncbi:hypothetical protein JV35_11785 [Pectobacterium betavasculorum]|uniref:Uncharacterized protein n=1 Tax=Pectobacterium betavasculorum TaxID=55207 RepID=A0ABR4UZR8_9GAMM|nr:hypothetical protein JV35_11785 [Pectobacterium betavasculorum]